MNKTIFLLIFCFIAKKVNLLHQIQILTLKTIFNVYHNMLEIKPSVKFFEATREVYFEEECLANEPGGGVAFFFGGVAC